MAEQANYQGEHLGLSLNRDAVFALGEALERLRFSVGDRASAAVPLRLPDGRALQLRLSLTDAGEIRDANGEYLDDDGVAHGDVTGDLAAHAEARAVLDRAARSNVSFELSNEQLDGVHEVDLDEVAARRVDAAIEDLPNRYGRTDEWVEQLRGRALQRAREALPEVLESTRTGRERVLASRAATATGAEVADPPTQTTAAEAVEDRYAYRGSTVGGAALVERLIADGLASPAARDLDVGEVVWQVTEVNAVDWDDPVDAHDFPRKLPGLVDDPRAQRGLPGVVSQPEPSAAAVNDAGPVLKSPAALQAPARPRNRFDDDRRAETDQARERRGWAAQATADGRHSHAAYWTAQAQRLDEFASQSRRAAIAESGNDTTADAPRRVQPPAAVHAADLGRTAGSDGRSGGAGMAM